MARSYALRQRLPAGDALYAQVCLPQAAGPRNAGRNARAELPSGEAGRAIDVPGVRESEGDGRVRAAGQCAGGEGMTGKVPMAAILLT
jgi:hypothetical protein